MTPATPETPNPTWYDVLGVSRTASSEEIKAAWRNATDKFEPGSGSGQFRMFSEAADVLLDPSRRAAYDASLDAPGGTAGPATTTTTDAPPVAPVATEEKSPDARAERRRAREQRRAARAEARAQAPSDEPATRRSKVVAAALALLMVVAVALASYYALQVRKDARIADARDDSPAAAERAAKAILSYDYRQLPADRERASGFLTEDYKKEYLETFALLEKNKDGTPGAAVQTKTVVTANVLGSGIVDAEDGTARVLVYVNQVSQKAGADPQIFQNRVAMTMEKDGNRWLVDDLKSY